MTQDSLKVTENEDGSFQLDWDENDPKWSFLNDKDQEWIENWFKEALEKKLQMYKNKYTIPVEEDPITGEQFITLPKECIESLKVSEGDTVEWIDNFDGTFTIKKV